MARSKSASGWIRVGISGWWYKPWRGRFYPRKLPHRLELAYAAAILPSIEINGTPYSLQRPESFADWYAQTRDAPLDGNPPPTHEVPRPQWPALFHRKPPGATTRYSGS